MTSCLNWSMRNCPLDIIVVKEECLQDVNNSKFSDAFDLRGWLWDRYQLIISRHMATVITRHSLTLIIFTTLNFSEVALNINPACLTPMTSSQNIEPILFNLTHNFHLTLLLCYNAMIDMSYLSHSYVGYRVYNL